MAEILDGKALAKKIREKLKIEVDNLKSMNVIPKLAIIMIGENSASKVYVRNKSKACEEIGIEYEEILLKQDITNEELISIIEELNFREDIHGILLQSPISKHLDESQTFNKISEEKDVDGFNLINVGKLVMGQDCFVPCTVQGIVEILKEYKILLEGANIVILGRSNIVGKPLFQCLLKENATITICHSKTKNIKGICKNADILISAIGKEKFVTSDMIKKDAVIIDVGINKTKEGKIVGDVDFKSVERIAKYITPVPGGVGPMTVAMLMKNVIKAAKNRI